MTSERILPSRSNFSQLKGMAEKEYSGIRLRVRINKKRTGEAYTDALAWAIPS